MLPVRIASPADSGKPARRWSLSALILIVAACIPAPPPNSAHVLSIPDLCPFHRMTGLPCPGCGMTRALICVAHGRLGESLTYHPLGVCIFVALLIAAVLRLTGLRLNISPRLVNQAAIAASALLLVVWAARLTHLLPAPP